VASSRMDLFLASRGNSVSGNKPFLNIDPENIRQSLAKLVLLIVDILRQALEREAVRRMERGTLTTEDIERVGRALMRVKEEIDLLKEKCGVNGDLDLPLDWLLGDPTCGQLRDPEA